MFLNPPPPGFPGQEKIPMSDSVKVILVLFEVQQMADDLEYFFHVFHANSTPLKRVL